MAGYLSPSQISKIESINNTLHDTFSQNITVYKNAKKTLIDSGKKDNLDFTMVSETFDARVYYIKTEEELLANEKSQVKIIIPDGSIKVVVKKDGFNFIQEARRVEFDGKLFSIKTDGRPIGLTGNLFYIFYLTPIDE